MGQRWGFVDITFYGKKDDYEKIGKESAIIMANHRSDIDWLLGWIVAERGGILGVRNTIYCILLQNIHLQHDYTFMKKSVLRW